VDISGRILLPTDGERGADQAVEYALDLAATIDATVHALYVVDESVYTAYPGDEFVQEHEGPQAALEAAGEEALAAIGDAAREAGVDVKTTLRYGRPAEEIVGALTRTAAFFGAFLMMFFYFINGETGGWAHGVVTGELLGLLIFGMIATLGAGRVLGIDAYLARTEFVKNHPRLQYLIG